MIRKTPLFITLILLVTLIAWGSTPRHAATNDLWSAMPTGESQYSSPDNERSKKQARKQAKKERKQSKDELPSEPQPALAKEVKLSAGGNTTTLRFADAHLSTGVRLRYAESGDPAGRPIILLHGYTDSWFTFTRVLPYFDPGWHVYIPDQRGHG